MSGRLLWAIVLVATASCGTTENGAGDSNQSDTAVDATLDTTQRADVAPELVPADTLPELTDTAPPPDTIPELPPPEDTTTCPGCPPGYCDEDTGTCLYCDALVNCPSPAQWCKDNECVETLCVPDKQSCKDEITEQVCNQDGESYTETPCEEGEACAAGTCQPVICEPGETSCDGYLVKECDPSGVGWYKYQCPPGFGCFVDDCLPVKSNLLVIFDTSSSMWSIGFGDMVPCICTSCLAQPFPICEDPDCPRSRLGLSKFVFNKFFEAQEIQSTNVVVTHFPMRIKNPPVLECNSMFAFGRGWYGIDMMSSDFITGDDGAHVTEDGGWFDQHLYEILAVPFPKTWWEPSLELAQSWVDFDEEVGPTEEPCAGPADCPGGFCASEDGQMVCWYHTNPELRALSGTPLGRSMFYAGEYYRRHVYVEGKACVVDEDCENVNYYCKDGACHDPYRACRPNQILVFTDGEESPATSTSEFHNPRVQAKRLRYGLCCDTDDDCFADSTCNNTVCDDYPHPNGGGGGDLYITDTPCRLEAPNGEPIQVTTHVIDLSSGGSGAGNNKQIADDGGGLFYSATALNPDDILAQMLLLIDVKENIMACIPEF